jgi:outer membrane protein OmpA-like peptidoglycan-associated protein
LALSLRRAESVKHEMIDQGIPAEAIKTVGLGYEHPVVWSDAKTRPALIKALSPNRRAEVLVN